MSDENIRNEILGFNVSRYLNWLYLNFYGLEEEKQDLKKMSIAEVTASWEKLAAKAQLKRRWKKLGEYECNKIISKERFLTLDLMFSQTKESHKLQGLKDRLELGIQDRNVIIKKEKSYIISQFDKDLFDYITTPYPILENNYFAVLSLLNDVVYYQNINDLDNEQSGKMLIDNISIKEELPSQIVLNEICKIIGSEWAGSSWYSLIYLFKQIKLTTNHQQQPILKVSDTDISCFLKEKYPKIFKKVKPSTMNNKFYLNKPPKDTDLKIVNSILKKIIAKYNAIRR